MVSSKGEPGLMVSGTAMPVMMALALARKGMMAAMENCILRGLLCRVEFIFWLEKKSCVLWFCSVGC